MGVDKFDRDIRKLKERVVELVTPQFSYYEQEFIRRIIKSILPQLRSNRDMNIAKEILEKTEWLDEGNT